MFWYLQKGGEEQMFYLQLFCMHVLEAYM